MDSKKSLLSCVEDAHPSELSAYLEGALGDATFSRLHKTIRFGQADRAWLEVLSHALKRLDMKSWIYKEGRERQFWILETSARGFSFERDPVTFAGGEAIAYARGFFDSEGGMPSDPSARLYLQFAQKDRRKISSLRTLLVDLGFDCGHLHNPSSRVDPDYWRFYVSAKSHRLFLEKVGTWHPRKRPIINERLKRLLDAGFDRGDWNVACK